MFLAVQAFRERKTAVPRALTTAIVVMGGSSLLLQVILVRELLTSFFGNELTLSLTLLAWLLLVAVGSWLAGRVGQGSVGSQAFALLQAMIGIFGPGVTLLSRAAGGRTMFPGEVVLPPVAFGLSVAVLAPACLLLGAQFAVACRLSQACIGARAVSAVYALEACGAALAGALFHFVLADRVGPVACALGAGLVSSLSAFWLAVTSPARRTRAAFSFANALTVLSLVLCVALLNGLAFPSVHARLDAWSLALRWRGFGLRASLQSRYGNLAVTEAGEQRNFFQDGSLLFTSEDFERSEWAAHLPLLSAPHPRDVLLIGTGFPATAREVLKHPTARVLVAEINPTLLSLAQQWLPGYGTLSGPRIQVHVGDARALLQRNPAARFDVIIVAEPDPSTAALNRYYTREFFGLAARHLRSSGLLALRLSGHEAFLTSERKLIHSSVYGALKSVFPHVVAVPGAEVHLLAALEPGVLTRDARLLAARLKGRGLHTRFVTPFSLETALLPFTVDSYLEAVESEVAKPNSDLQAVTHSNYLRLWLSEYARAGLAVMSEAERAPAAARVLLAVALALTLYARISGRAASQTRVILFVAATGFALMGLQLAVMLGFQALAGCLYYQIGILTALHMAGLAAGGWLGGQPRLANRPGWTTLLCGAGICGFAYGLGPLLRAVQSVLSAAPVCLGLASFGVGLLGGAAFPLAVALLPGRDPARTASLLYAWDLLGGASGSLLVGLLMVPALGLPVASMVIGDIVAAAAILLVPMGLWASAAARKP